MVVAVAAGQQPNLTLNPREPAATITAFIVQVALGDLPHGSIEYQSIFAAGLVLVLMTLVFNVLGHCCASASGRRTDGRCTIDRWSRTRCVVDRAQQTARRRSSRSSVCSAC